MTTVRLQPMSDDQYEAYLAFAYDDHSQDFVKLGLMSEAEAREKTVADFERLLPDGPETPGNHLWIAYDGETEVGVVWLNVEQRPDGARAFIYDIVVDEPYRRRGYGKATMLAAEQAARELGAVAIGLNVFGHNTVARHLYDQLGFDVVSTQMRKRL